MNVSMVLTAMLPEHLLLAGIVALVVLEVAAGKSRAALVLALAIPVLLISRDEFAGRQFHILVLSSLYGACLMLGSASFLTLFLGLELLSLPVYVLVLLALRRPQSAEAALKYLVLGGTASATLLMGASLLYGWSGTLELAAFAQALDSHEPLALTGAGLDPALVERERCCSPRCSSSSTCRSRVPWPTWSRSCRSPRSSGATSPPCASRASAA